ncbi:MAG TPA: FprA family A-type flavoprotein [Chloroflexi bacterium]|nr:FprA family A-type flavoprotein [Chloroflexota bacterium]
MHNIRKITDDLFNIGVNDRRITMFENAHPVPRGMSYNSYLLLDEKTVLLDGVDLAVVEQFWQNLNAALDGRQLDYLVINHLEPDHCHPIPELLRRFPDLVIVGTKKTFTMISQFYEVDLEGRMLEVKDGDELQTGKHTLTFYSAPMVHWPEVMVTYDQTSKILFSADAFGTFGATDGRMYADQYKFEEEYLPEVRRYYANIIGKYGRNVKNLFDKLEGLEIEMLCTLHGPIWRKDLHLIMDKYQQWASYTPEERGVVIAYGTVYGNTALAAEILANKLADAGVENVRVHDVTSTHPSYILSDCFRFDRLVFASATFNAELFPYMETLLLDLKAHNLTNRSVALIENGSWALASGKKMREILEQMKGITLLEQTLSIKSSLKDPDVEALDEIAKALLAA